MYPEVRHKVHATKSVQSSSGNALRNDAINCGDVGSDRDCGAAHEVKPERFAHEADKLRIAVHVHLKEELKRFRI